MRNLINKKYSILTILIFLGLIISPLCSDGLSINVLKIRNNNNDFQKIDNNYESIGTEYWALLFAVGEYRNNPHQNRPSMLRAVEDLYDVLLDSPHWQVDHIHKVKGRDASGYRLMNELLWLKDNSCWQS